MIPHLAARDTTLLAISRAPLSKLLAFKARMGWTFEWLSSAANDFNHDFAVSFTPEEIKSGVGVFIGDEAGNIFHTYSCCARGLDMMNAAYHYLDLTPLGATKRGYRIRWTGCGCATSIGWRLSQPTVARLKSRMALFGL